MSEFFTNDYVIKVVSGHPGYVDYGLYANRETWQTLLAELASEIEKPETVNDLAQSTPVEKILASKYATLSGGQTSRVYLSFHVTNDMATHHVRPSASQTILRNLSCVMAMCFVLVVLALAAIGLQKIVSAM